MTSQTYLVPTPLICLLGVERDTFNFFYCSVPAGCVCAFGDVGHIPRNNEHFI